MLDRSWLAPDFAIAGAATTSMRVRSVANRRGGACEVAVALHV